MSRPKIFLISTRLSMVWIEYWDESHFGRWQDTWKPGPDGETLVQTDSQLTS